MLALIVGTALAIATLAFVLFPLFSDPRPAPRRVAADARQAANVAEQDAVIALREIEFDKATGKLSDADYDELRTRYTDRALTAMRSGAAGTGDAVEAAVLAFRARLKDCVRCGPRPEPDAIYCSNCGLYLAGNCASCGSAVTEPAAAYCASCGAAVAA